MKNAKTKTSAGLTTAVGVSAAAATTAFSAVDSEIEKNPVLANAKTNVKTAGAFVGKAWGALWGGGPEADAENMND